MDTFAMKLGKRAAQLGISNAEAARRIGLDERRYAHYVSGRREPDLATLIKIATALGTTPIWLLGLSPEGKKETQRSDLLDRLLAAGKVISDKELNSLVIQAEALAVAMKK